MKHKKKKKNNISVHKSIINFKEYMVLNFGGQRKWLQNKMVGSAFRMMEFLLSTKLSKLITSSSL